MHATRPLICRPGVQISYCVLDLITSVLLASLYFDRSDFCQVNYHDHTKSASVEYVQLILHSDALFIILYSSKKYCMTFVVEDFILS